MEKKIVQINGILRNLLLAYSEEQIVNYEKNLKELGNILLSLGVIRKFDFDSLSSDFRTRWRQLEIIEMEMRMELIKTEVLVRRKE